MKNEINMTDNNNYENLLKAIRDIIIIIKKDYDNNIVIQLNIFYLNENLNNIK